MKATATAKGRRVAPKTKPDLFDKFAGTRSLGAPFPSGDNARDKLRGARLKSKPRKRPRTDPLPEEPRPGRYRHYKGKDYEVIGLARHSETEELLVVYKLLYGDFSLWVRPHAMFTSTVPLPDGTLTPRFAYVAPV